MPQSNSSAPSSESTPPVEVAALRKAWRTLAWILAAALLIEFGLSAVLQVPSVEKSSLGRYFNYGASIETKLLKLVRDPTIPKESVFNTGWLNTAEWPPEGQSNDIAVYGMSFADALVVDGLRVVAPELSVRSIGAPGVPLAHSYTAYGMDAKRRTAKLVVITLLPVGIQDMLGMVHDTNFSDHTQPHMWPRYELNGDVLQVAAQPVLHSIEELRGALLTDRALWRRHLDVLEAHDASFSRFLYAKHWTERPVLGRIVRRAWAKSEERDRAKQHVLPNGDFNPQAPSPKLTRAMLRAFIRAVRANGEEPLVVLFAQPGSGDVLLRLLIDVLQEEAAPYLTSETYCDSKVRDNYYNMHFVPRCNKLMAQRVLEIYRDVAAPPR